MNKRKTLYAKYLTADQDLSDFRSNGGGHPAVVMRGDGSYFRPREMMRRILKRRALDLFKKAQRALFE